jgi:hypothetical protein
MKLRSHLLPLACAAAALALPATAAAQAVITEFMADNNSVKADQDGDFSDWIEIHNPSASPVNLEGWSLTDNAALPARWSFPAVSLNPGDYLVVWASNKNRRTPGSQLHTNFRLDPSGEYLALIKPDGTKATEFAPVFPPQVPNLAYGFAAQTNSVKPLAQGATGRVLVPTDASLADSWRTPEFNDASWTAATNGIGFETGTNEFGPGWTGDVSADGPAAYYRLEQLGTPGILALNAVANGPAGTHSGGVLQNIGTVQPPTYPGFDSLNTGARFDGTNDKIDIPWQANLNAPSFSFSFWMRWTGGNGSTHRAILTSRESSPIRGFTAYILPTTNRLSFWTGTGSAWETLDAPAATGTVTPNQWYHVAGTFDAISRLKTLYLNGTQIAQNTATAYTPNSQFPLRIGSGSTEGAGQFWFAGDLDETTVFDRALSPAEVLAQFQSATTGTAGTEAADTIAAQLPKGWWRLKDSTSPVSITATNSGTTGAPANGNFIGTINGGVSGPRPPSEAGMPADNLAPRFSGGYIETPYHASLNPSIFTVECWARPTGGTGATRAVVSSRNDQNSTAFGYILYAASNNTWQFWSGSGASGTWDPITGPAVVLNQWTHLAATYDGTVKRFYVNGTLVGTGTLATFNPNGLRPLRIGAGQNESTPAFFFTGDIDEVAIHGRALSTAEVSSRYALGKNNTQPPPLNDFSSLISSNLQASMLGINASAYFRLPFSITNTNGLDSITLRMKYDDGFVAWLNGVQVASGNPPATPLAWNSAAGDRSSNAEASQFESFSLNNFRSALRPGQNVLAIQGLNLSASNPDFLQLAELETRSVGAYASNPAYLTVPTPGTVNSNGAANPGPVISLDSFSPALPTAATDLTITCRVQPVFNPIASVNIRWRTGFSAEQSLAMNDSGTNGDAVAGDSIFTAVLPRTSYAQGNLVRWFFQATDSAGSASRWPLFLTPPNTPQYTGTMIAATGFTTQLPVWYWFAQNTAAAASRTGTYGAVFFNGKLYDNVFIRLRGAGTSSGSKKFDFNSGYHCLINPTVGTVEEANLNGTSLGGADTIIRPSTSFELMRRAGLPACGAFPVMMRLNGALDTASGRGGVAYFVEQVDERMLERYGLDPEGALYKMDQRSNLEPVFNDSFDGVQKRTRLTENNSDLQALVDAVHSATPDDWSPNVPNTAPVFPAGFTARRQTRLFDLMNLANLSNYLAARVIIADTDDTRKNFYLYRDSDGTGEWSIIPWDKDGTLGIQLDAAPFVGHPFQADWARRKTNSSHQWNYLWEGVFNDARLRPMMLRRLRTLMDSILGSSAGAPEALADSFWSPITSTTPVIGTYNGQSNASIKSFFNNRRNGAAATVPSGLFSVYSAANGLGTGISIPPAQPANAALTFGTIDYLPVSGNQEEEFVQLLNSNTFAVDISGWELRRGIEHKFEPGTVVLPNDAIYAAGKTTAFRARATSPTGGQGLFVQGSFNGTISARGEIIELWDPRDPANLTDDRLVATINTPATPTPLQQSLRITEIMFDPPAGGSFAPGEYEFLELRNIGTAPLTLTGASFTEGITFTFQALTLDPGARTLVVKNPAAFASRYPGTFPVAGTYSGSLDNSGERIRLVDATGEEILDFSYDGTWFPNTHGDTLGGGRSLVIINDAADWSSWDSQLSWRASSAIAGSPATDDAPSLPATSAAWNGTDAVTARGEPGRSYRLQRSVSLTSWSDVGWFSANPDGDILATDPTQPTSAAAFYRLVTH